MNAPGIIASAGGLALAGSFVKAKGFPSNGYAIVVGTLGLAFFASMVGDNSPITKPVRALAWLMLLAAVIRYVPGFSKTGKA